MPKTAETCELPDGRLIPYFLKKRKFYYACFRAPDDRRTERSTREPSNKRRARQAATRIIQAAYEQRLASNPSWDEAVRTSWRICLLLLKQT